MDNYIRDEIEKLKKGTGPTIYINDIRSGYNLAKEHDKRKVYEFFDKQVLKALEESGQKLK